MLSILDTRPDRNCQGHSRREFLRIGSLKLGALGLSGLALPSLLASRASAKAAGEYLRDKSVVLLFLQGGPSHIELFDPKMSAPAEVRSVTGEVATTLPGITFGGTFPKLAALAEKFSVVRSYASGNADHSYQRVASGNNPLKATMGAVYSRIAGVNHPDTGMPANVLVLPEAVDPQLKLGKNFETDALPTLTAPGDLGPGYAAFNPVGGGELQKNMELKIPRERFDDRRTLLALLDHVRRQAETTGRIDEQDKYKEQAFDIVTRGAAQAFNLSKEDPATIRRYDTSGLFSGAEPQRWYDMARGSNLLGKQMLLARRLCEAGCGFVTVSDCGWDMHSNENSPKGLGGMRWLGPQVDHAVAAFIQDVEERGLSDRILLIVTGEMGRTPRLNRNGGRDHYSNLTPLLVYGGGLNMGQVIGASDRTASEPATTRYKPEHLLATVMHVLFDVGQLRLQPQFPRDIIKLTEGEPIEGLVG